MVFVCYALLNAAVTLFFFIFQKKNLHVLEILVYWLVATILFQNYSAFFYMNMKYFMIPERLNAEMAHFINRTVLYPVCTLLFLNRYVGFQTTSIKLAAILCAVLFFTGLEWLADWSKVLIHTPVWNWWWSLSFWLLYLLITIWFVFFFRKKLKKGVQVK